MNICTPVTEDRRLDSPVNAHFGSAPFFMVVGGIGMGALAKLQAAGTRVYLAEQATVRDTLAAHQAGTLREVTADTACGHHGHGGSDHGCR